MERELCTVIMLCYRITLQQSLFGKVTSDVNTIEMNTCLQRQVYTNCQIPFVRYRRDPFRSPFIRDMRDPFRSPFIRDMRDLGQIPSYVRERYQLLCARYELRSLDGGSRLRLLPFVDRCGSRLRLHPFVDRCGVWSIEPQVFR